MLPKAIAYSRPTTTVGITADDATTITVTALTGYFPTLAAGEYCYAVLSDDAKMSNPDATYETVKVTAIDDSDPYVLTVERNAESTHGAQEWASGTAIACFGTAAAHDDIVAEIESHIDNTTDAHGIDDIITDVSIITGKFYDNAGAHNSIYRGKYLGTSYTAGQSAVIAAGTFDDLYIGDYWTINGVNWRIAAFNYFYNCGDTALTTHHVVIVPDTSLASARMEATNITTNGYVGSEMRVTTLPIATTGVIAVCKAAFPGKVIQHRQLLCNASSGGLASGWAWTNCEVELMNEAMVYGTVAWGMGGGTSGYNVASSNGRLPLFALRHDLMHIRASYWLRDVVSATGFASVRGNGNANGNTASNSYGVRPAFSIS